MINNSWTIEYLRLFNKFSFRYGVGVQIQNKVTRCQNVITVTNFKILISRTDRILAKIFNVQNKHVNTKIKWWLFYYYYYYLYNTIQCTNPEVPSFTPTFEIHYLLYTYIKTVVTTTWGYWSLILWHELHKESTQWHLRVGLLKPCLIKVLFEN